MQIVERDVKKSPIYVDISDGYIFIEQWETNFYGGRYQSFELPVELWDELVQKVKEARDG